MEDEGLWLNGLIRTPAKTGQKGEKNGNIPSRKFYNPVKKSLIKEIISAISRYLAILFFSSVQLLSHV